jgi:hypothetical protein
LEDERRSGRKKFLIFDGYVLEATSIARFGWSDRTSGFVRLSYYYVKII